MSISVATKWYLIFVRRNAMRVKHLVYYIENAGTWKQIIFKDFIFGRKLTASNTGYNFLNLSAYSKNFLTDCKGLIKSMITMMCGWQTIAEHYMPKSVSYATSHWYIGQGLWYKVCRIGSRGVI